MAALNDSRKIFSLSSFLVSLGLMIFCGYLAFTGGFFNSLGNFLTNLYPLLMVLCGGFAISSCIHLIMVPKATPQNKQEKSLNGPVPQLNAPTPGGVKNSAIKSASPSKPLGIAGNQKKPATNPNPKIPATPPQTTAVSQAVKLIGPVAKNNQQFLETFIKLASIAKDCQELVENEKDLSKKEQVRLSLQRREFRQMYSTVKNSRFETF